MNKQMEKLKQEQIKALDLDRAAGGMVLYDNRAGVCFGPIIDWLEASKVMEGATPYGDFCRTPEMEEGMWVPNHVSADDRVEAFLDHWGENLVSSSDQAGWLERWERFVEYERAHIAELYGESDYDNDEEDN